MAGEPGELGEGDDHGGGPRHRPRRPLPEVDLGRLLAVVGADPHEEQDQERDRNHHHPGPLAELAEHEDQGGDAAGGATKAIDGAAPPPARGPRPQPVVDHPRLGQGEAGKDADGEQRDQRVGVPPGGGEKDRGEHRQHPDARSKTSRSPRMAKPWGRRWSLASRLASTGRPPKEVLAASASTRVTRMEMAVVGPTPAEGVADDLVEDGVSGPRLHVEALDEDGQAQQHHPQQGPQHQLGRAPGSPGERGRGAPRWRSLPPR